MDHVNYFKDLFESIPDYRKIVLSMFLKENYVHLLNKCGYIKTDNIRLSLEFKNKLLEQIEENLDFIKNDEESFLEKLLNE